MTTIATRTITGIVTEVKRRGTSKMGNPSWHVTLDLQGIDGVLVEPVSRVTIATATNAQIGYAIGNREYRETPHTFILDRHGRILYARH